MPLRGTEHSLAVRDHAPYFKTLAELDTFMAAPPPRLEGILDYRPRRLQAGNRRGKLLVCHDYKGGYTEKPSALAYTFNFWSLCDTFIYFAHHCVTIPPSGWITAAHRNGVKMLGTLIFEGAAEDDCLRLLFGKVPRSTHGPATPSQDTNIPISPHYARVLADLAYQRGFDGYLLNVECPLRGSVEQARSLAAWVSVLRTELHRKVGPHAEVIWYDSVIFNGQLRWQDRLNSLNLPFYIPSTGFFTNYTWPPHYPGLTAQYFANLDPSGRDASLSSVSNSPIRPKALRDIYVGVDVWGRGSHGGGGFGCYKALTHIDPRSLGLSAALFGPAWTWESEEGKEGWTWEKWWVYERMLWLGPVHPDDPVVVPKAPLRPGELECPHGPYQPVSGFFPRLPPPNPLELPFLTSFSPGAGFSWFVEGARVLQTDAGWTDVDKQGSLGDLVWPRPGPAWEEGDHDDVLPLAAVALSMDDAWLGGSSLRLTFSGAGSGSDAAFFRCVWLPVQSLALTPRKTYRAVLVYKLEDAGAAAVDLDLGLSVKSTSSSVKGPIEVTPVTTDQSELPGGWTRLVIDVLVPSDRTEDLLSAVGLVVGFATEDPTQPYNFSLLVGLLAVYPPASAAHTPSDAKILWVDYAAEHTASAGGTTNTAQIAGSVTWELASSFARITSIGITSPEDPRAAWAIDHTHGWFPSFAYFNIYAAVYSPNNPTDPRTASFIGTTGLDGRARRFFVEEQLLPPEIRNAPLIRFYVQGVTDRGEVMKWDRCSFVDARVRP